jgi:ABC-2 type transport system permease protein
MRRMLSFANRTMKEILRDPLTLGFGLGFPVILLLLLSLIQANIPVEMFEITHLAPGITIFGLSFITLFSAQLIAKDRTGSLLTRLYTTPLKATDFILGYLLPIIPMCLAQTVSGYILAMSLGMQFSINIIWATLMNLVPSFFYIALGLLCGSALTEKQVGGICGALLTNLSAWISGIWFDIQMLGKVFMRIANALPFIHAVELERAMAIGDFKAAIPHLWWVLIYAVVLMVIAIMVFLRQMKNR